MNAELSRRVARIAETLIRNGMSFEEKYRLSIYLTKVDSFEDLPSHFQDSIKEAEKSDLHKFGTHEGLLEAWDTRGRGRKEEDPKPDASAWNSEENITNDILRSNNINMSLDGVKKRLSDTLMSSGIIRSQNELYEIKREKHDLMEEQSQIRERVDAYCADKLVKIAPNADISLYGCDPSFEVHITEEAEKLAKEYPKQMQYLHNFHTGSVSNENAWAEYSIQHQAITLRDESFASYNGGKFYGELSESVRTGFHPPGCDSPDSVFCHEFGHHVYYYLGMDTYEKPFGRENIADKVIHLLNTELKDHPCSEYAKHDRAERWAESFVSVYYTPPDKQTPGVKKLSEYLHSDEWHKEVGITSIRKFGTSEGLVRAWDTRGRGRHEEEDKEIVDDLAQSDAIRNKIQALADMDQRKIVMDPTVHFEDSLTPEQRKANKQERETLITQKNIIDNKVLDKCCDEFKKFAPKCRADFTGISPKLAIVITNECKALNDDYPKDMQTLAGIKAGDPGWGAYAAYSTEKSEIILSDHYFSGWAQKDFDEHLQKDVASGFHPAGCDTPGALVCHEFGHHVYYEQLRGLKDLTLSESQDKINANPVQAEVNNLEYGELESEPCSEYAKQNNAERWAESFMSAYYTPPDKQTKGVRKLTQLLNSPEWKAMHK
jgi:hypothetical protein